MGNSLVRCDSALSSALRQYRRLVLAVEVEEIRLEGDETMKLQDQITSAQTMSRNILRLNVAEESRNNGPSLPEIRERAFEIHIDRGGIHASYLAHWLHAEHE